MQLSEAIIKHLRDAGILGPSETAEQEGDLVIARDVLTQNKRILPEGVLKGLPPQKMLLKG